MNASPSESEAEEAPDLVCQLDNVQGMVDAFTTVRWKRHQVTPIPRSMLWCFPTHFAHLGLFMTFSPPPQDAVVELSEHGVVLIVEETGCLQAKVYLQREVVTTTSMNFHFFTCRKIVN